MGRAVGIKISDRQRAILEKWIRNKAETPYRLIERCRLIVLRHYPSGASLEENRGVWRTDSTRSLTTREAAEGSNSPKNRRNGQFGHTSPSARQER